MPHVPSVHEAIAPKPPKAFARAIASGGRSHPFPRYNKATEVAVRSTLWQSDNPDIAKRRKGGWGFGVENEL
jgi:hypothetical protein